jgi:hypothetical protein
MANICQRTLLSLNLAEGKMNSEQYIQDRLEPQIKWYDKKSLFNKRLFYAMQSIVIVAAALIPLLNAYTDSCEIMRFIIGALGSITAILTGLVSLFHFKELWSEYRTTSETLKHEKYLFLTSKGPYSEDDPFSTLVERVEALISRENTKWYECLFHKGPDKKK